MGLQALVPTSAASCAALQLFRQDPDPVPEAATAAGAGAWGKAHHGRAPGFGGSVAKVLQRRVCFEPFDDRSSCCTFCQNEMQRRGKRKQAHLADDTVSAETGLTYKSEVRLASLAKRRSTEHVVTLAAPRPASSIGFAVAVS